LKLLSVVVIVTEDNLHVTFIDWEGKELYKCKVENPNSFDDFADAHEQPEAEQVETTPVPTLSP
jgi:hypothetical protein